MKKSLLLFLIILLLTVASCAKEVPVPDDIIPLPNQQTSADNTETNPPIPSSAPLVTTPAPALPTEESKEVISVDTPWGKKYTEVLKNVMLRYPMYQYMNNYTVHDVNLDGTPELIVKEGTCEADFYYCVYTYVNGEIYIMSDELLGGNASLAGISDKNVLLVCSGHMGYEEVIQYTFGTNGVSEKKIYSGEVGADEEYKTASIKTLPYYELDDYSGLSWKKNPANNNQQALNNLTNKKTSQENTSSQGSVKVSGENMENFVELIGGLIMHGNNSYSLSDYFQYHTDDILYFMIEESIINSQFFVKNDWNYTDEELREKFSEIYNGIVEISTKYGTCYKFSDTVIRSYLIGIFGSQAQDFPLNLDENCFYYQMGDPAEWVSCVNLKNSYEISEGTYTFDIEYEMMGEDPIPGTITLKLAPDTNGLYGFTIRSIENITFY